MSQKTDTQVRKVTKGVVDSVKFRAIDLLNGIKETWPRSERRRLAAWLQDQSKVDWSDDYRARLSAAHKLFGYGLGVGLVAGLLVSMLVFFLFAN